MEKLALRVAATTEITKQAVSGIKVELVDPDTPISESSQSSYPAMQAMQ